MLRAHSHPAILHGTLHSFTHAIDVPPCRPVSRCIFESGSNFFAQYLNARQKCAALRGNKGDSGMYIRWKKDDTIGKGKEKRKRKRKRGRETRERFYRPLMPFHPLPLFCGRNTKNLTFPSSAPPVPRFSSPALTLQSFRSFYVLFSFSASRAIFPRSGRCDVVVPRDKFLQLEPANDGHRQVPVIWKG